MAKRQNITVTGRAANQRIEQAIPEFQKRLGMPVDQATAVAIRLESVGRLHGAGLISASETPKGPQRAILAALATTAVRSRTSERSGPAIAENPDQLRRIVTRRTRRKRRR